MRTLRIYIYRKDETETKPVGQYMKHLTRLQSWEGRWCLQVF
jgi:hypothetical protein